MDLQKWNIVRTTRSRFHSRAMPQRDDFSCNQQAQEWDQAFSYLQGNYHHVAEHTTQMGLLYDEQFLVQVPSFAQHLTTLLQDIYLGLGGHMKSKYL